MAAELAKAGRNDLATSTRMRLLTTYTQGRFTEQMFDLVKDELAKLPASEGRTRGEARALGSLRSGARAVARGRARSALHADPRAVQLAQPDDAARGSADVELEDPALMLSAARCVARRSAATVSRDT
jgi:hypothetical protein